MDKTNVTIRMPGRLLSEKGNFMNVDERTLVEKLIELLQTRKNLVNVSFQSGEQVIRQNSNTITKIEILLADDNGDFKYYED